MKRPIIGPLRAFTVTKNNTLTIFLKYFAAYLSTFFITATPDIKISTTSTKKYANTTITITGYTPDWPPINS